MALIKCSSCGGTVGASAESCPHCGKPMQKKICPECKSIVGYGEHTCPNCGEPLSYAASSTNATNSGGDKAVKIISFLSVWIAIIMYFVLKGKKPELARECCRLGVIGMFVVDGVSLIFVLLLPVIG